MFSKLIILCKKILVNKIFLCLDFTLLTFFLCYILRNFLYLRVFGFLI